MFLILFKVLEVKWTHLLGFGRIISWLPLTTWLRPGPQKWSASRNSGIGWCVPPLIALVVTCTSGCSYLRLKQKRERKRIFRKWRQERTNVTKFIFSLSPAAFFNLKFMIFPVFVCVWEHARVLDAGLTKLGHSPLDAFDPLYPALSSCLIATEFEMPSSQFVTRWIVPGDDNREMRKKGIRRVLSPYNLQFP